MWGVYSLLWDTVHILCKQKLLFWMRLIVWQYYSPSRALMEFFSFRSSLVLKRQWQEPRKPSAVPWTVPRSLSPPPSVKWRTGHVEQCRTAWRRPRRWWAVESKRWWRAGWSNWWAAAWTQHWAHLRLSWSFSYLKQRRKEVRIRDGPSTGTRIFCWYLDCDLKLLSLKLWYIFFPIVTYIQGKQIFKWYIFFHITHKYLYIYIKTFSENCILCDILVICFLWGMAF